MKEFLTILACFAGLFAFGFGLAGFLGLMNFEAPTRKGDILLCLLDYTFTGGAFTAFSDLAHNWESRGTERKFLYAGFACGVVCIALVIIIRWMS